MNLNLGAYSKELSVAGLLVMWLLLDVCKVDDAQLKYAIMGLIASITGWHVLNNLPGQAAKS